MKTEIKLTVDSQTGEPIIEIKHFYKKYEIEQKLLKVFIERAYNNGLTIYELGGVLNSSDDNNTFNKVRIKANLNPETDKN